MGQTTKQAVFEGVENGCSNPGEREERGGEMGDSGASLAAMLAVIRGTVEEIKSGNSMTQSSLIMRSPTSSPPLSPPPPEQPSVAVPPKLSSSPATRQSGGSSSALPPLPPSSQRYGRALRQSEEEREAHGGGPPASQGSPGLHRSRPPPAPQQHPPFSPSASASHAKANAPDDDEAVYCDYPSSPQTRPTQPPRSPPSPSSSTPQGRASRPPPFPSSSVHPATRGSGFQSSPDPNRRQVMSPRSQQHASSPAAHPHSPGGSWVSRKFVAQDGSQREALVRVINLEPPRDAQGVANPTARPLSLSASNVETISSPQQQWSPSTSLSRQPLPSAAPHLYSSGGNSQRAMPLPQQAGTSNRLYSSGPTRIGQAVVQAAPQLHQPPLFSSHDMQRAALHAQQQQQQHHHHPVQVHPTDPKRLSGPANDGDTTLKSPPHAVVAEGGGGGGGGGPASLHSSMPGATLTGTASHHLHDSLWNSRGEDRGRSTPGSQGTVTHPPVQQRGEGGDAENGMGQEQGQGQGQGQGEFAAFGADVHLMSSRPLYSTRDNAPPALQAVAHISGAMNPSLSHGGTPRFAAQLQQGSPMGAAAVSARGLFAMGRGLAVRPYQPPEQQQQQQKQAWQQGHPQNQVSPSWQQSQAPSWQQQQQQHGQHHFHHLQQQSQGQSQVQVQVHSQGYGHGQVHGQVQFPRSTQHLPKQQQQQQQQQQDHGQLDPFQHQRHHVQSAQHPLPMPQQQHAIPSSPGQQQIAPHLRTSNLPVAAEATSPPPPSASYPSSTSSSTLQATGSAQVKLPVDAAGAAGEAPNEAERIAAEVQRQIQMASVQSSKRSTMGFSVHSPRSAGSANKPMPPKPPGAAGSGASPKGGGAVVPAHASPRNLPGDADLSYDSKLIQSYLDGPGQSPVRGDAEALQTQYFGV